MMWALNSPSLMQQMVSLQSGTTRKRISRKNLATVRIPIPDLDEQRRIVDVLEHHLSRLDAACALLKEVRVRLNTLLDSFLHQSLYGSADAGSLSSVGSVADLDSGPAFSSKLFGGPGEGTRLLRGDNIEPGRLRWERTRTWPDSQLPGFEHLLLNAGDIILAMDRPVVSAGLKLATVTDSDLPALLVQRVARIRPRADAV